MANVSIRPRKDSDLPACAEVLGAVYRDSGYPVGGVDNALQELRGGDRAWVAVAAEDEGAGGEAVIGHVAMNRAREEYVHVALWREKRSEMNITTTSTTTTGNDDDDRVAVLARLFVHPEARGCGAATALVRTVEEAARTEGCRLLILALVKDQTAIRLYRKLGWEYYGTVVFRWREGGDKDGEKGREKEMDAECFVSPLPSSRR